MSCVGRAGTSMRNRYRPASPSSSQSKSVPRLSDFFRLYEEKKKVGKPGTVQSVSFSVLSSCRSFSQNRSFSSCRSTLPLDTPLTQPHI